MALEQPNATGPLEIHHTKAALKQPRGRKQAVAPHAGLSSSRSVGEVSEGQANLAPKTLPQHQARCLAL